MGVSPEDTEEMWKRFANGPDGIAVQSNVSRLKKSLIDYEENICIRKVEYVDNHRVEFTKFGCPFYPFSIKIKGGFSPEKELRVILGKGKACKKASPLYKATEIETRGVELSINPIVLFEKIIISPYAPSWFLHTVKALLYRLNIELPVIMSKLANISS